MKEQKIYVCDFCGTQYKDKQKALYCEKFHHSPRNFKNSKYHAASCPGGGYPDYIEIEFDDGKVIRYKR